MEQEQVDRIPSRILSTVKTLDGTASADRIHGENAIGVETTDGYEYFLSFERA